MHTILGVWDFAIIALLASTCGGLGAALARNRTDDDLALRNARKLDVIMRHLGIATEPVSQPGLLTAEVRRLADQGDLIEAIKRYRQETGADLRESRDAVEEYRSRLHQ